MALVISFAPGFLMPQVDSRFMGLETDERVGEGMLLGIDIGGTKIAYALADDSGEILLRSQRPTGATGRAADDLARMLSDIRELCSRSPAQEAGPDAVGVSIPGPLDAGRRRVIRPPNLLNWEDVPVADYLEAELNCPVTIENDANAAALAEWQSGAGQGLQDLVFLTMSTGVGAGLILDGALYRGRAGNAGEVGHAPVEWPGDACECGLRGCLEAYVGGRAWTKRLRAEAPEGNSCLILAGERERLEPTHLLRAAREGDAWALGEMQRFNFYLARAIVHLVFTLSPQAVILGTIPVAAGETLCFEPIREMVRENCWPHQVPSLEILPAALGGELPFRAGLGVALAAREASAGG